MDPILRKLKEVQQLKALKSEQRVAEIRRKETKLRGNIDEVKSLRFDALKPTESTLPMRTIGSDILWLAWLDRTQANLNAQLSHTLAVKESVQKLMRHDIGRKNVAEEISHQAYRDEAEKFKKAELNSTIEQAVQHRSRLK